MSDLYTDGSFMPSVLSELTPQTEWSRGVTTDECIHINFSFTGNPENITLTGSLQKLIYETYVELGFYLTGIRYNIDSHKGKFVFSGFEHVEKANDLKNFLLYEFPVEWSLPYTIARESEVFCIEDLYAIYIADYDISSFNPQVDGFTLQIERETEDKMTQKDPVPN